MSRGRGIRFASGSSWGYTTPLSEPPVRKLSEPEEVHTSATLQTSGGDDESEADRKAAKKLLFQSLLDEIDELNELVEGGQGNFPPLVKEVEIPELKLPEEDEIFSFFAQDLKVPPIEYESTTELTQKDAEFMAEECFGVNEVVLKKEEFIQPKLPTIITSYCNCFILGHSKATDGRLELPPNYRMPVILLCVDSDDVLHCRYHDESVQLVGSRKPQKITSFQKMMATIEDYYRLGSNQKRERFSIRRDDIPMVGQVVIAKVSRILYNGELVEAGRGLKKEYQRARVVKVNDLTVTVELLDDYGRGDVSFHHVFKMKQGFAFYPPQRFTCELKLNEFFEDLKIVHKVLRASPILRTHENVQLNSVDIEFHGEYSKTGLPLVHVYIRIISTPSKWITLKSYVTDNIKHHISPFCRLVDKGSKCAVGKVLRADDIGNLLIQLQEDAKLVEKMELSLKHLEPVFAKRLDLFYMRLHDLLPELAEPKIMKKRIYVTVFRKGTSDELEWMLYRVKLEHHYEGTDWFRVRCIDYGHERNVRARQLLPLELLCQELSGIPSLTMKAHLDHIMRLDVDDDFVNTTLLNNDLLFRLVREWPSKAFKPEVSLHRDPFFEDNYEDYDKIGPSTQIMNVGDMLAENKVATKVSRQGMMRLERMAMEYLQDMVKEEKKNDSQSYFDSFYGNGCSFNGENFKFLDDPPLSPHLMKKKMKEMRKNLEKVKLK